MYLLRGYSFCDTLANCLLKTISLAVDSLYKKLKSLIDAWLSVLYTNKRTIGYDIRQWLHKCRREGYHMAKTVVKKNESLDDALRRFKRTVSKSGTLAEYRKREFYEKPSVRRKLKSEAARKRKKF